MEHADTYTPDDFAAWFCDAVTETAVGHVDHMPADRARASITDVASYLEAHNQDLVVDEAAAIHLPMCAVVLGAYKLLRSEMAEEAALAVMTDAMTEPFREWLRDSVLGVLSEAPDPFFGIVNTSRAKEVHLYGDGFGFERPSDDERCYHLVVRACLYNEFCTRNGAPELTQVWCAFDTGWMDVVNNTDRGVAVDRPVTLGLGGDHCDFIIRRTTAGGLQDP